MPSRSLLLYINGAILLACAVLIIDDNRKLVLTALLLFLPLLDHNYRQIRYAAINKSSLINWSFIISIMLVVCISDTTYSITEQSTLLISIALFTALPEEWFFRRYFQDAIQNTLKSGRRFNTQPQLLSNLITSTLFTMLHLPIQGAAGMAVFIPSLILGYIYQKKKDLIFVILIHSLFNIIYIRHMADINLTLPR